MDTCLYRCGSKAGSTQEYHVYPASASNIPLLLEVGVVCDKCNAYFAKLESYFVHNQPGASAKLMSLGQTKKGKQPTYESQAGVATRKLNEDSFTLNIPLNDLTYQITRDGSIIFKGVAKGRSFDSKKISRVLGKIAIEFVYSQIPCPGMNLDPYTVEYDPLRRYVRFGDGPLKFVWFAYKDVNGQEGPPQIGRCEDGDTLLGVVCVIRLPGFHYAFPLPPFIEPHVLRKGLPDWTIVEMPGLHPSKDLEATIPLHPRKPDAPVRPIN